MNINKEIKKWQGLVYNIINSYRQSTFKYKTYIDWDEVEQAGIISLWNAIQKYNPDKGSFKNYAITAIKRGIVRQIQTYNSIENNVEFTEQHGDKLITNNKIDDTIDTEKLRGEIKKIINSMENSLRSKDILISNLYGESVTSIAKRLDVTHQYVSKLLSENNKKILSILRGDNNDNRE